MSQTFCKHLRTKRMFVDATPEEAFADKPAGQTTPCHFWCNRTQSVVGVDDQPAHKNNCDASRPCFEE